MAERKTLTSGRARRAIKIGGLASQVGSSYLWASLRRPFLNSGRYDQELLDTHLKNAKRIVASSQQLRGAFMKLIQMLSTRGDLLPIEALDILKITQSSVPPMDYKLISQQLRRELGKPPEQLFAYFERDAFAAASLGQVHRARLPDGEEVAVKIQYPGIARSIQSDFRNLFLFMLPARLGKDWENTKDQFDDLRMRLEQETDYAREAANLERARSLFRDFEGIVVPRVYRQYSTERVLTMERLEGVHLREFMARAPSQAERNEVARKIVRAWYRLYYAGRMFYPDQHPGNYLVMDDGRVGLIDFGLILPIEGDEWEFARKMDRPLTTGRLHDRIAAVKEWSGIGDDEPDRLRLNEQFAEWCWRSRSVAGEFDFSDEADFRRGIELFSEMIRRRYSRSRPNTPTIARGNFSARAILYLLKARINIAEIAEEEVKATGWDRSDYAPRS